MSVFRRLCRSRLAYAFAGALIVAAVGGVSWAAIPDPSGVIHGCYNDVGRLRVIDPAVDQCRNRETVLDWNVQGLQGLQGQQGIQGTQGVQGPPGADASTQFAVLDRDGNVLASR